MNQMVGVCVGQPRSDLASIVGNGLIAQRPLLLDQVSQINSLDVLHHDVVRVVTTIHIVNPNDVGMVQSCQRLSFTMKPLQNTFIFAGLFRQDF